MPRLGGDEREIYRRDDAHYSSLTTYLGYGLIRCVSSPVIFRTQSDHAIGGSGSARVSHEIARHLGDGRRIALLDPSAGNPDVD